MENPKDGFSGDEAHLRVRTKKLKTTEEAHPMKTSQLTKAHKLYL